MKQIRVNYMLLGTFVYQYDIVVLRTQQTGWGYPVVTSVFDEVFVGGGGNFALSHVESVTGRMKLRLLHGVVSLLISSPHSLV